MTPMPAPAKCRNPACPCDSFNGQSDQFCCKTCRNGKPCTMRHHVFQPPREQTAAPATANAAAPAVQVQDSIKSTFASAGCSNARCPCDSFNGQIGEFCCRTCRNGQPCKTRFHVFDPPRQQAPAAPAREEVETKCTSCGHGTPLAQLGICDRCANTKLQNYRMLLSGLDKVEFYEREQPFYEFTNFYACRIVYNGKEYATSEHLFQATKFLETAPEVAEQIQLSQQPREAFDLAHMHYKRERADWLQYREQAMLDALRLKFQNPHLREILLLTGDRLLIEHTFRDRYWGDGGDGSGQNRLGKLLMQVRDEVRPPVPTKKHAEELQEMKERYCVREESVEEIEMHLVDRPPAFPLQNVEEVKGRETSVSADMSEELLQVVVVERPRRRRTNGALKVTDAAHVERVDETSADSFSSLLYLPPLSKEVTEDKAKRSRGGERDEVKKHTQKKQQKTIVSHGVVDTDDEKGKPKKKQHMNIELEEWLLREKKDDDEEEEERGEKEDNDNLFTDRSHLKLRTHGKQRSTHAIEEGSCEIEQIETAVVVVAAREQKVGEKEEKEVNKQEGLQSSSLPHLIHTSSSSLSAVTTTANSSSPNLCSSSSTCTASGTCAGGQTTTVSPTSTSSCSRTNRRHSRSQHVKDEEREEHLKKRQRQEEECTCGCFGFC